MDFFKFESIQDFRYNFQHILNEKYGSKVDTFESFTLGYVIGKFNLTLEKSTEIIGTFDVINDLNLSKIVPNNLNNNIEGNLENYEKKDVDCLENNNNKMKKFNFESIKDFRYNFQYIWDEKFGSKVDTFESFTLGYVIGKFNLTLKKSLEMIGAFDVINDLNISKIIPNNLKNNFFEGILENSEKTIVEIDYFKNHNLVEMEDEKYNEEEEKQNIDKSNKYYLEYLEIYKKEDEENEKMNLELINKLQQEDYDYYQNIRLKEDEKIVCSICLTQLTADKIFPLEECDHVFHEDCILEYLRQSVIIIFLKF